MVLTVLLWYLSLPALFVLSLVPQFTTKPLHWLTKKPEVQTLTLLEASQGRISLDFYKPSKRFVRGKLVIFHAANEQGKDDPRLKNLAEAFARTGLLVYVPTLPSLNRQVFHPNVLEEMEVVIAYVAGKQNDQPLQILSFSVGVGPELIVASQKELADKIDLLVAMGGYYDLVNVIAFHTTEQGQDPFGLWLFARYYAQFLPPPDAKILYEIADLKWQSPNAQVKDLEGKLGPEGRRVMALLNNKDPQAVAALVDALPRELKDFLEVFDPGPALANLQAPVLLLHSRHDPVIPFEESQKLFQTLQGQGQAVRFIPLQVFDHVNPIFPALNLKNLFKIYFPEFGKLYRAAYLMIYP